MKSYYISIFVGLSFFFVNCKSSSKSASSTVIAKPQVQEIVKNIKIDKEFVKEGKNMMMNIEAAALEEKAKGLLKLIISYSGGCKEHDFELISKGNYLKTNPPKINLYLIDNQKEDPCRSIITDTLFFNLEHIKYPSGDKLILLINDSEKTIEYAY